MNANVLLMLDSSFSRLSFARKRTRNDGDDEDKSEDDERHDELDENLFSFSYGYTIPLHRDSVSSFTHAHTHEWTTSHWWWYAIVLIFLLAVELTPLQMPWGWKFQFRFEFHLTYNKHQCRSHTNTQRNPKRIHTHTSRDVNKLVTWNVLGLENFIEMKDHMKIAADAQCQRYALAAKPTEGVNCIVGNNGWWIFSTGVTLSMETVRCISQSDILFWFSQGLNPFLEIPNWLSIMDTVWLQLQRMNACLLGHRKKSFCNDTILIEFYYNYDIDLEMKWKLILDDSNRKCNHTIFARASFFFSFWKRKMNVFQSYSRKQLTENETIVNKKKSIDSVDSTTLIVMRNKPFFEYQNETIQESTWNSLKTHLNAYQSKWFFYYV